MGISNRAVIFVHLGKQAYWIGLHLFLSSNF